jgi:glutamyl/glutaminyl-tRNA synthetase
VQKSGAIFDEEKLKWFNKQYMSKIADADFIEHAKSFVPEWLKVESDQFNRLLPLLKEKIIAFGDIPNIFGTGEMSANGKGTAGELAFVHAINIYSADQLLWKKNPSREVARSHLTECRRILNEMAGESFAAEAFKIVVWPYADANGRGDVLWPLRMALTGQDKSPDPFTSASILGKAESLRRVDVAIEMLGGSVGTV